MYPKRRRGNSRIVMLNQNEPQGRSWGSVADWVNIVLAGAVIFLSLLTYDQTTKATEATVKADSIATEALRLSQLQYQTTVQNEGDARVEATKKALEDDKKYQKQFSLQKQSIQAQIDAFKRQEERFLKENEPFLQVSDIILHDSTNGRFPFITYTLTNLGKSSVWISTVKYKFRLYSKIPDSVFLNKVLDTLAAEQFNSYSNSINANSEIFEIYNYLTPLYYHSIATGRGAVIFSAEFVFKNLINGKIKKYRFAAQIQDINGPRYYLLMND